MCDKLNLRDFLEADCRSLFLTLHDFLLVAEPGLVLLLSCEELELISSSSSSSSSKFILLDIPSQDRKREREEVSDFTLLQIGIVRRMGLF